MAAAFVPASFARRQNSRLSVLGDDHFDMEELRQRISQETSPQLFAPPPVQHHRPEQVHVILFNPHTKDEGMHTIEYPKGSGNNVILAFEDSNDCHKFAAMLRAQHFFHPQPQQMDLKTLECYCQALGVYVQVVPKGTRLIPPSQNVKHFGHDPTLVSKKEQLGHLFEMTDWELEYEQGVIVEEEYASWE